MSTAIKIGTVITLVSLATGGTAAMFVGDASVKEYSDKKNEEVRKEFNDEIKMLNAEQKVHSKSLTRIETILVNQYGPAERNVR